MRRTCMMFVIAAGLAGCGRGEAREEAAKVTTPPTGAAPAPAEQPAPADKPAPAAAADDASGTCEMKVEGALTLTDRGGGGSMAIGTDYWHTDEALRQALAAMGGDGAKVEEKMKKDPRLVLLNLNCLGQQMKLSFVPSKQSKYADVPFGPGTYPITMGRPGAGQFMLIGSIGDDFVGGGAGGTLAITRFDAQRLTATFELPEAVLDDLKGGAKKTVRITGTIDYACTGTACR